VIYKQSQTAVKYLRKLLGGKIFDNPKDHEIISRLIRYCVAADEKNIVLDFFAGSGTTGQAILHANAEDSGQRQFILVQLPEPIDEESRAYEKGYRTISEITRDRVRKAIKQDQETGTPNGFRAFKLSSSNFKIWDADSTPDGPERLAEQLRLYTDNVEGKRGPQDILYELILKSGFPLSSPVQEVSVAGKSAWAVSSDELLICLDNPVSREALRAMIARMPKQMLCLDAAFRGDDALKTNIVLEAKSHGITFRTV
jgi:adenine-specific DNA-methyltransferase